MVVYHNLLVVSSSPTRLINTHSPATCPTRRVEVHFVGRLEGKARRKTCARSAKGTVARFEDRFVSVVVIKSNSYDDGCALLHGAELDPLIVRKDRRKALSHQ